MKCILGTCSNQKCFFCKWICEIYHPRAGWDFACAASQLYTWECVCSVCCYSCSCMLASVKFWVRVLELIFFFFKSVSLKLTLQVPNWVLTQIWGGTVLNKMREWINFLWPAKGTVPLKVDLLQKLTMWTCYNLHCCNFFRIFCAQNSGSTEWGAAD